MKMITCKKRPVLLFLFCLFMAMAACPVMSISAQDVYSAKAGERDCTVAMREIDVLSATITALERKSIRTNAEDNLLTLAKSVEENSAYFDEATLKDFNDAAYIVRLVEERNVPMKGKISADLAKAVEKERVLYNDYLKATEKSYEKIATLLGTEQEKQ